MNYGILGAMNEEISSLIELIHNRKIKIIGSSKYYYGSINACNVVIAKCGVGKSAAASTATTMINIFKIDSLIFTGVAGGLGEKIKIGDIVVAKQLCHHDMDARPLFPRYEIPFTNKKFMIPNQELTKLAMQSASAILSKSSYLDTMHHFNIKSPQAVMGTIASGDQFITTASQSTCILSDLPEVIAVEMEGAAVAQVCENFQVQYTIIRTISDLANKESSIDFPSFIKNIASLYSKEIILHMLSNIFNTKHNTVIPNEA